jgi:hypothetical protein
MTNLLRKISANQVFFFMQRLKKKQGIPILVVLGLFGEMTARDQE